MFRRRCLFKFISFLINVYFSFSLALAHARPSGAFVPKAFSVDFVESYQSALTGKIKSQKGKIYYQYPGKIRYTVQGKNPVIFLSNQDAAYLYTPPLPGEKEGTLTSVDPQTTLLAQVFDSLRFGPKSGKIYDAKKKSEGLELIFKDKLAKEIGIQKLLLHGKNLQNLSALEDLEVYKIHGEQRVSFKFSNFKEEKSYPEIFFSKASLLKKTTVGKEAEEKKN